MKIVGCDKGWYGRLLEVRDRAMMRLLSGVADPGVRNLAAALYFGVDGGIRGAGRAIFVASGTVHLFSVSGMHVGMLALLLWLIFRPLRYEWRWLPVLLLLAAYVLCTGARPPALRAFWMIAVFAMLRSRLFYAPPLDLLAGVAALMLIWNPRLISDLGAWYSFVITGTLLFSAERFAEVSTLIMEPRLLMPRGGRARREISALRRRAECLIAPGGCLAAFAGGAGLSLYARGVLPAGSVAANLLLMPLIPLLFVLVPVKMLLPGGCGGSMVEAAFSILIAIAGGCGELFGSISLGRPALWQIVLCYLLLFGMLGAVPPRGRKICAALLAVSIVIWCLLVRSGGPALLVVSGADGTPPAAAWVDPGSGRSVLVNVADAPTAEAAADFFAAHNVAAPDLLIVTRPRRPFVSGLGTLCRRMTPRRITLPELDRYSSNFLSLLDRSGGIGMENAGIARDYLLCAGGGDKAEPLSVKARDGSWELTLEYGDSGRIVHLVRPGKPELRVEMPWRHPAGVLELEL